MFSCTSCSRGSDERLCKLEQKHAHVRAAWRVTDVYFKYTSLSTQRKNSGAKYEWTRTLSSAGLWLSASKYHPTCSAAVREQLPPQHVELGRGVLRARRGPQQPEGTAPRGHGRVRFPIRPWRLWTETSTRWVVYEYRSNPKGMTWLRLGVSKIIMKCDWCVCWSYRLHGFLK